MKTPLCGTGLLLVVLALPVLAEDLPVADDVPARLALQRERLQAEREAIEAVHSAQVRECWQKFAVNACLRQARLARYQALDPLRALELTLNAEERAWRSRQREQRLQQKQDAQERQP